MREVLWGGWLRMRYLIYQRDMSFIWIWHWLPALHSPGTCSPSFGIACPGCLSPAYVLYQILFPVVINLSSVDINKDNVFPCCWVFSFWSLVTCAGFFVWYCDILLSCRVVFFLMCAVWLLPVPCCTLLLSALMGLVLGLYLCVGIFGGICYLLVLHVISIMLHRPTAGAVPCACWIL